MQRVSDGAFVCSWRALQLYILLARRRYAVGALTHDSNRCSTLSLAIELLPSCHLCHATSQLLFQWLSRYFGMVLRIPDEVSSPSAIVPLLSYCCHLPHTCKLPPSVGITLLWSGAAGRAVGAADGWQSGQPPCRAAHPSAAVAARASCRGGGPAGVPTAAHGGGAGVLSFADGSGGGL